MKIVRFLVVTASGDVRVVQRPRLAQDEVAVRVTITLPGGWGSVVGDLAVQMPDPPTVDDVEIQA